MYALYDKGAAAGKTRYRFREQASLFGCNEGYIPWLLRTKLSGTCTEPYRWHVNIEERLSAMEQEDQTLVIDLKPKSKQTNLSLYEVVDVWGYSDGGWTPILLHLMGLFIDEDPKSFDRNDFGRSPAEVDSPIFSMMYLSGTVKDGALAGRWAPPGPSPTNSVLLWPEAFAYFWEHAKKIIDIAA
jgi:hypothetical protein